MGGYRIGPRPVRVMLMPAALFRFSLKYELTASENEERASPRPAAVSLYLYFNVC